MKNRVFSFVIAAAVAGMTIAAAEPVRELKVLTIGNSFADSVFGHLPKIVAADPDCRLVLAGANIGGCSFERHWREHLKSEADPQYRPYRQKYTLRQLLTRRKWDVVTIQQVSYNSWQPKTFQPYADNIIALVRELAPQAEIVIQQTWAYNAADPVFSLWKISQQEMHDKLTAAYAELARKHDLGIIPSGHAVMLYRRHMGDKLVSMEPADISELVKPAEPVTNDVCGRFGWQQDPKTGNDKLVADYIHLNARGTYLQSLVWYAFLFGKDPELNAYVPEDLAPEEVARFKKLAKQAVMEFPQVKK